MGRISKSGIDGMKIRYRCGICKSGIDERNE